MRSENDRFLAGKIKQIAGDLDPKIFPKESENELKKAVRAYNRKKDPDLRLVSLLVPFKNIGRNDADPDDQFRIRLIESLVWTVHHEILSDIQNTLITLMLHAEKYRSECPVMQDVIQNAEKAIAGVDECQCMAKWSPGHADYVIDVPLGAALVCLDRTYSGISEEMYVEIRYANAMLKCCKRQVDRIRYMEPE